MRSKMIKGEGDDVGKIENMGVIFLKKGRNMKGKPPKNNLKTQKWTIAKKKRPYKGFTLTCAHRRKNDKQNPKWKMMIEEQRNLKAIQKTNKREKRRQLASYCLKLLKYGLTRDGVERICNVYLKHHPIKINIQSDPNTIDHGFTTSYNHHLKLIWWSMKSKHIMKL